MLVGAERVNQPAEGHSHLNPGKPFSYWELANIFPSNSTADIPLCSAKGATFSDLRVAN